MSALSKAVINRISKLGFCDYGVVDLTTYSDTPGDRLQDFINAGYHGTMTWMADTLARRNHPQAMWADAKSALVIAMNYGPDQDPLDNLLFPERANISVYARNRDYHDIIKGRLKEIAGLLARETSSDVKVFVDTAPLMEKPLAEAAGLGWQGKHTNLVSERHGSWLFLGVILSTAALTPTPRVSATCGTCRACLDICPTDAFPAPYQLDARRCISYLTIEHAEAIDEDLRAKLGNRIYGCDDCLAVCPWNKFAVAASEIKLQARQELNAPTLAGFAAMTDAEFRQMFSGSPIKRIGHKRFLRNVLYAIGNAKKQELIKSVEPHLASPNPVIQDAAKWAKSQLRQEPNAHG